MGSGQLTALAHVEVMGLTAELINGGGVEGPGRNLQVCKVRLERLHGLTR